MAIEPQDELFHAWLRGQQGPQALSPTLRGGPAPLQLSPAGPMPAARAAPTAAPPPPNPYQRAQITPPTQRVEPRGGIAAQLAAQGGQNTPQPAKVGSARNFGSFLDALGSGLSGRKFDAQGWSDRRQQRRQQPLDDALKQAKIQQAQPDPLDRELKQARIADLQAQASTRGQSSPAESRLLEAESRRQRVNEMLYDPEHETAQNFRAHLYQQGFPEGSLDSLNYDQMKALRGSTINPELEINRTPETARSQAQIAGARAGATGRVGLQYDIQRMGAADEVSAEREDRASGRLAEETEIEGYRKIGGRRVSQKQGQQARGIIDQIGEIEAQAAALAEIQDKLGASGLLGPIADVFEPEVSALIAEARIRQLDLDSAIRQLNVWGVPQKYELELLAEAFPHVDSVGGVMKQGRAYQATVGIAREKAKRKLSTLGYEHDDGGKLSASDIEDEYE